MIARIVALLLPGAKAAAIRALWAIVRGEADQAAREAAEAARIQAVKQAAAARIAAARKRKGNA